VLKNKKEQIWDDSFSQTVIPTKSNQTNIIQKPNQNYKQQAPAKKTGAFLMP